MSLNAKAEYYQLLLEKESLDPRMTFLKTKRIAGGDTVCGGLLPHHRVHVHGGEEGSGRGHVVQPKLRDDLSPHQQVSEVQGWLSELRPPGHKN